MKKYTKGIVFVFALCSIGLLMGAFTQIDFSSQVQNKPTTLAGYGITDAASTTALVDHTNNSTAHNCTEIASSAALALKAGVMTDARQESVTITPAATSTVTFSGTPIPANISAAVISINGLIQPYGTFSRTSDQVMESTAGDVPLNAVVTILVLGS